MEQEKDKKELTDSQAQKVEYYWRSHVALLDFVDLMPDSHRAIKAKLKTKILDLAHEVRNELLKHEDKE